MQRELDGLKQSSDEAIAKAARAANRVLAQGAERGGELRERGQAGESLTHLLTYSLLTYSLTHCLHTCNSPVPHSTLTSYSRPTYLPILPHYLLTARRWASHGCCWRRSGWT